MAYIKLVPHENVNAGTNTYKITYPQKIDNQLDICHYFSGPPSSIALLGSKVIQPKLQWSLPSLPSWCYMDNIVYPPYTKRQVLKMGRSYMDNKMHPPYTKRQVLKVINVELHPYTWSINAKSSSTEVPLFNIVKATMQMHVNKKQSTPIFEEDEIIMLMLSILNTQLNDRTLPLKKSGWYCNLDFSIWIRELMAHS